MTSPVFAMRISNGPIAGLSPFGLSTCAEGDQHLLAAEGNAIGEDSLNCDATCNEAGYIVLLFNLLQGASAGVGKLLLIVAVENLELNYHCGVGSPGAIQGTNATS